MIKNISVLLFSLLILLLTSCDKKDSNISNLIGNWQSTKIDSLIQYIIPNKDNTFQTGDFKNNTLEINDNGSFTLIELKDTIYGNWTQYQNDSLRLKNKNIHGKYLFDSKIAFIDKNNLTISYTYGFESVTLNMFDDSSHVVENTINNIKIYYKRK